MIFPGRSVIPPARRTRFIRLGGEFSLFGSRSTLPTTSLHARTGFHHILIDNYRKVTDHFLVKLERLLEFRYDVCGGFMEHLHVESCVLLPDGVGETPSPPTVDGLHFTAILGDEFLIACNHGFDLAVFQVGIDNERCLVLSLNYVQFHSPPSVNLAVRR